MCKFYFSIQQWCLAHQHFISVCFGSRTIGIQSRREPRRLAVHGRPKQRRLRPWRQFERRFRKRLDLHFHGHSTRRCYFGRSASTPR